MHNRSLGFFALLVLALAPSLFAADLGLTLKAASTGAGLDLSVGMTPQLNLRIGASGFTTSRDVSEESIDYSADAKLLTGGLMLDWFPAESGFRVTLGGLYNDNHLDLKSKGTGIIEVNGVDYHLSDIGYVDGKVTFAKFAPYLGLGWGNAVGADGDWHFAFDFGAIYQGSPDLKLAAHPNDPAQVPADFYSNLEIERKKTEKDLDSYRYYPVISIGISRRF